MQLDRLLKKSTRYVHIADARNLTRNCLSEAIAIQRTTYFLYLPCQSFSRLTFQLYHMYLSQQSMEVRYPVYKAQASYSRVVAFLPTYMQTETLKQAALLPWNSGLRMESHVATRIIGVNWCPSFLPRRVLPRGNYCNSRFQSIFKHLSNPLSCPRPSPTIPKFSVSYIPSSTSSPSVNWFVNYCRP